MEQKNETTTPNEYPYIMNSQHIREVLGIGQNKVYEVMNRKDFPLIRIGRHKKVQRDAFFKWLERWGNEVM
ncbi:helix-turn-helix domain-containing protein [Priestia flexa]|uniref:helix-turn-helix domain-containing protein n=1 Tax=Priestia flexa TaxID=86664 RepID=UPI0004738E6C|nr:helix-turn-helix domain-containing protein [Priestia flexa]